jgi:hypothetical protein
MSWMFASSDFNGDLSKWNVGNVRYMGCMFFNSAFNHPIKRWNTENVEIMDCMFSGSPFNQDIEAWNIESLNSLIKIVGTEYKKSLYEWTIKRPDLIFDIPINTLKPDPKRWMEYEKDRI